MLNLLLITSYLGCLSSNQMLSMLLLLVASYMGASIWFISNGIIYTGLLYILVYVGAIVVLIMFVVQLTNTSLSGDNSTKSNYLTQNSILIVSIFLLLILGYSYIDSNYILNFSNINLTDYLFNPQNLSFSQNFQALRADSLWTLANSIFNEYGFILIISVHAIVLAIIGPIKLALTSSPVDSSQRV